MDDSRDASPAAGAGTAVPSATGGSWSAAGRSASLAQALPLLAVALQLLLVLAVAWRYQLESRTFFDVMLLATGGFVVHALLPLAWRLPFFVGLSLAAVLVVFGLFDGVALIGLGLVLIGVCHLRLPFAARVALVCVTGGVFALWRTELLPAPWSVAIWPILGAMFMFRLALYLYALEHDKKPATLTGTLAYFFMLPNVCFPLFPVVDYGTFRRSHYDSDAAAIHATGMRWIVRGLWQLLLYRFVYVHLTGDPMELRSLGDLVQFLLATFALYLRVSGQFHLITGILHLFGFRLPETHHLYFLAHSFNDFWRRINIYWKDFMMKLVYYPSFFRLKRYGTTTALVGATIVVFIGTWLLHSYQWFWLRGGFPLTAQDGLFWGALGVLVVVGSLRELRASRKRQAASAGWSWRLAWRTVATFCALCVLWSLWSAESVMGWVLMWGAAAHTTPQQVLALAALLLGGFVIAGHPWDVAKRAPRAGWRAAVEPAVVLLALLAASFTNGYADAAPKLADAVSSVRQSTLNARDEALQHKGYYENLDNDSRLSAQLWNVVAHKPAHWVPLDQAGGHRARPDFLADELRPGADIRFLDQRLTTNSHGMRDLERALARPAGVLRIAVLGPSHVMGSGVADAHTFTRQLETRLNKDGGVRYEVLNFGVAAYALTQQLALLEDRVFGFEPDVVVFTDSPRLDAPVVQHLLRSVAQGRPIPFERLRQALSATGVQALAQPGVPLPYDALRGAVAALGVPARMPWTEAEMRLRRSTDKLLAATLQELAERTRAHGAVPVFLALDNVVDPPKVPLRALGDARAAGMPVFDLLDLWHGRDQAALRIAPWDSHPNAQGNALIAERLAQLIERHAADLRLRR